MNSFLWENPNKGRTYDSTIEFRHYILEFPNIGRDLYKGIYGSFKSTFVLISSISSIECVMQFVELGANLKLVSREIPL